MRDLDAEGRYELQVADGQNIPKELLKVGYFGFLSEGSLAGRGWLVRVERN